jgi:DNA mismatch repair protein MutL
MQHAAHERLVYERLKRQMADETGIAAQALLIPEIVDLSATEAARLLAMADDLARLGWRSNPLAGRPSRCAPRPRSWARSQPPP